MTLDDLVKIPYLADGRTVSGCDCYGLVRLARDGMFNRGLMPTHGDVMGADKKRMTKRAGSVLSQMTQTPPIAGSIATAWRGRLCIHVGIVIEIDGRSMILEADHDTPYPRITSIASFEERFLRVEYYD